MPGNKPAHETERLMNIAPTETKFDAHTGDIVCITRVVIGGFKRQYIYGVYCTGPQANATDGNGNELEFGFEHGDLCDEYPEIV